MRHRAGVALFNVLMFCMITTMLLVAGIQFTQAALKEGTTSTLEQQAYQVALAGVNHALMWLQVHRAEQPRFFDPRVVPTEPDIPAETTTANEQFGLIVEYPLDTGKSMWARYEVGRSQNAPARGSLTQSGPHLALYPDPITCSADDVSLARNADPGTVWRVRSRGYIFHRENATDPFVLANPKPSRALTLEGEVKNLAITIPRAAVYSFKDGTDSGAPHIAFTYAGTTAGNTEISNGGASGVRHLWSHADASKISKASKVAWTGGTYLEAIGCTDPSTSTYVETNLDDQLEQTFGVTTGKAIEGLADDTATTAAAVSALPDGMRFVYLNPGGNRTTATFDDTTRLSGEGILFVDGSLVVKGTSAARNYWHGLIFVTGHYTQTGNVTVIGAVMAGETIAVGGEDASQAKILYSHDVLTRISDRFSGFRLDRSTLKSWNGTAPTF